MSDSPCRRWCFATGWRSARTSLSAGEEERMKWLKYLLVIGVIAGIIVMVRRKQSS
jgi:hypothetical protein